MTIQVEGAESEADTQGLAISERAGDMEIKVDPENLDLEEEDGIMRKQFVCNNSEKELSCAKNLKVNLKSVKEKYNKHSDWKQYISESEYGKPKCNKCGKLYSNVRNLKCHVRNVHILKKSKPKKRKLRAAPSIESPGKILEATLAERICLICKKMFGKKSEMKKHLVRHTKIFKNLNVDGQILRAEDGRGANCINCGKWDAKANNIKNHIALVHYQLHNTIDFSNMESYDLSEGGTALKGDGTVRRRERFIQTFLCEFCEKVFNDYNRSSLNKHIRFVHEGIRRKKKDMTLLKGDENIKNKNKSN